MSTPMWGDAVATPMSDRTLAMENAGRSARPRVGDTARSACYEVCGL